MPLFQSLLVEEATEVREKIETAAFNEGFYHVATTLRGSTLITLLFKHDWKRAIVIAINVHSEKKDIYVPTSSGIINIGVDGSKEHWHKEDYAKAVKLALAFFEIREELDASYPEN